MMSTPYWSSPMAKLMNWLSPSMPEVPSEEPRSAGAEVPTADDATWFTAWLVMMSPYLHTRCSAVVWNSCSCPAARRALGARRRSRGLRLKLMDYAEEERWRRQRHPRGEGHALGANRRHRSVSAHAPSPILGYVRSRRSAVTHRPTAFQNGSRAENTTMSVTFGASNSVKAL